MRQALAEYAPCQGDEAIGWLTHVGRLRISWTFVRPSRHAFRITTWDRRWPEQFRGESRVRTVRPVPMD